MNPETTALVMIEFQNDFTSEGGSLHGAVQGVMERPACWPTRSAPSRRRGRRA